MNPDLNEPLSPSPNPIPPSPEKSRRITILGLSAIVLGLVFSTLLFAPPRKKAESKPTREASLEAGALPSGCTRNQAGPGPAAAPPSGCGHCDAAGASAAASDSCGMHAAPNGMNTPSKRAGAPHE